MENIIGTLSFNHKNIKGHVDFIENLEKKVIIIKGELHSNKYKNSEHGFHIHEAGDLTDNCLGACSHFNPYNKEHGGPNNSNRHVGDLGNIKFNDEGICNACIFFENRSKNVDFEIRKKDISFRLR